MDGQPGSVLLSCMGESGHSSFCNWPRRVGSVLQSEGPRGQTPVYKSSRCPSSGTVHIWELKGERGEVTCLGLQGPKLQNVHQPSGQDSKWPSPPHSWIPGGPSAGLGPFPNGPVPCDKDGHRQGPSVLSHFILRLKQEHSVPSQCLERMKFIRQRIM